MKERLFIRIELFICNIGGLPISGCGVCQSSPLSAPHVTEHIALYTISPPFDYTALWFALRPSAGAGAARPSALGPPPSALRPSLTMVTDGDASLPSAYECFEWHLSSKRLSPRCRPIILVTNQNNGVRHWRS